MKDFKVYQASGMLKELVKNASDVRKTEQTISGSVVSFTADAETPMKIVVDIDSTGWTGCEVKRTGKNLLDAEAVLPATLTGPMFVSIPFDHKIYNKIVDSNEIVTVKVIGNLGEEKTNYALYLYDGSNNGLLNINGSNVLNAANDFTLTGELTIMGATIPEDAQLYIRVYAQPYAGASSSTVTAIMLAFGADSEYEPYSGTTVTVTFPDSVGTVTDGTLTIGYDGSVTLETGWQTYTLTSVSPIETLIGDNNIWADAGPVSVTYPI